MLPLLTPSQMYDLEKRYFVLGNPSLPLMERAAAAVLTACERHFGRLTGKCVHIACGGGNNGGDGWALATLAAQTGADVTVLTAVPPALLHGDAATCSRRAIDAGLTIATAADDLSTPDIWVDALFGIGLNKPIAGDYAAIISRINRDKANGAKVISVDCPSGLNLTTGRPMGTCVNADVTVTFQCAKRGHFIMDGLDLCGAVDVTDIGITSAPPADAVQLIEPGDAFAALPKRRRNMHKGDCGHLLIIAGSMGMCGASMYAAKAALRMGTGLVTLAVPKSIQPIMQTLVPAAMCIGLPEEDGYLCGLAALPLRQVLVGKTAVVIGPGLSHASPNVVEVALSCGLPTVVDADALNIISRNPSLMGMLCGHHVITPHPGEAKRLLPGITDEPVAAANALRERTRATVLLKGAASCICGKHTYISASGTGGMAVGGSGDVLSGMIGALLAQRVEPATAAWAGSELHGLAGEAAAQELTDMCMTAEDTIDHISAIMNQHKDR